MGRIIYNVTVSIDKAIEQEWLEWMKTIHISEVMATGLFLENRIMKVLVEESEGINYSIQYTCLTMDDYHTYRNKYAPELQKKHTERYKDRFAAFRTLLEIIE
jgi:hypothetical protein